MTMGVFMVLIGGMTLITFPEIFQRLKEIRSMSNTMPTTDTNGDDTADFRTREFR